MYKIYFNKHSNANHALTGFNDPTKILKLNTMNKEPQDYSIGREALPVSPITNNENLKFESLEDEYYRTYEFEKGEQVTIDFPVALNVSSSGGHRILDANGVSHYIPKGWKHLYWKVREGQPHFAF